MRALNKDVECVAGDSTTVTFSDQNASTAAFSCLLLILQSL